MNKSSRKQFQQNKIVQCTIDDANLFSMQIWWFDHLIKRLFVNKHSTGPTPQTVADFWQMIWEVNSCTIVMLTNLKEGSKVGRREWRRLKSPSYISIISTFHIVLFCRQNATNTGQKIKKLTGILLS